MKMNYVDLAMITMVYITMVTGQSSEDTVTHHSMCTTDSYRDLPLNMQNEHQCLLMEQFQREFFNDREDRIRRYKELNHGLMDLNEKMDRILSDLDPEYFEFKDPDLKGKETGKQNCTASNFKLNVDFTTVYSNCYDLKHKGKVDTSGVYPLKMANGETVMSVCDMDRGGGGWTVIQKRIDGSVNFNRNWTEYKYGFGNPNTEFWLGLEYIHLISANQNTTLRIDLWDWNNKRGRAEYSIFYLMDEHTNYTVLVDGYHGNIGDSLSYHSNCSFSTPERDNDRYDGSCASQDGAGWWYNACSFASLNGRYHTREEVESNKALDGIMWYHWKETYTYPLPRVEMKIRPAFP